MAYASYNPSCTAGAANTKGAYTQVVASTPFASSRVYLTPEYHSAAWRFVLVDVATGAAGAETVLVPNLVFVSNANNDVVRPELVRFPVAIPAGTRVTVRAQCTDTGAFSRLLAVTLIGMQEPTPASGGGPTAVAYVG